ncbi:hypothetical protein X275_08345 [Marinitoga sp. 1197]|uniref:hypothetical protein n=1 Tax=Marinitoga sp. 1197 TaxID=1428449 RepID=UPI000640FE15|nr:hypothetical protein [Marinitoga sp. 1197]KLO21732.1 hypothetical protein X275_08345 [Marinitoga sp. 1197]
MENKDGDVYNEKISNMCIELQRNNRRNIYLIYSGKIYFLSITSRFGKMLTISTLYYLFKGEKTTQRYIHIDMKF